MPKRSAAPGGCLYLLRTGSQTVPFLVHPGLLIGSVPLHSDNGVMYLLARVLHRTKPGNIRRLLASAPQLLQRMSWQNHYDMPQVVHPAAGFITIPTWTPGATPLGRLVEIDSKTQTVSIESASLALADLIDWYLAIPAGGSWDDLPAKRPIEDPLEEARSSAPRRMEHGSGHLIAHAAATQLAAIPEACHDRRALQCRALAAVLRHDTDLIGPAGGLLATPLHMMRAGIQWIDMRGLRRSVTPAPGNAAITRILRLIAGESALTVARRLAETIVGADHEMLRDLVASAGVDHPNDADALSGHRRLEISSFLGETRELALTLHALAQARGDLWMEAYRRSKTAFSGGESPVMSRFLSGATAIDRRGAGRNDISP